MPYVLEGVIFHFSCSLKVLSVYVMTISCPEWYEELDVQPSNDYKGGAAAVFLFFFFSNISGRKCRSRYVTLDELWEESEVLTPMTLPGDSQIAAAQETWSEARANVSFIQ